MFSGRGGFEDSCGLKERSLCPSDLSGRKTDTGKDREMVWEKERKIKRQSEGESQTSGRLRERVIWRLGEG